MSSLGLLPTDKKGFQWPDSCKPGYKVGVSGKSKMGCPKIIFGMEVIKKKNTLEDFSSRSIPKKCKERVPKKYSLVSGSYAGAR